jgi:tetratricopeptide (TPR) repeat protein
MQTNPQSKFLRVSVLTIACTIFVGSLTDASAGQLPQDQQLKKSDSSSLPPIEAQSLNGVALRQLSLPAESKTKLEQALAEAKKPSEANPTDADSLIWVGRRLGYLSRFRDSIDVFTQGVERFPDDPRFLRHRGHRWITVREFARAIEDLERAARMIEGKPDQVEPDGQPNAAGIPTSTLHTNIWYHLGLARFLTGDFAAAETAFRKCLAAAENDDMQVATLDWLYMTLSRLDRKPEADKLIQHITADLKILENHAYHRRLLLYRGLLPPNELLGETGVESTSSSTDRDVALATNGFGVAHWYLVQEKKQEARKIFEQVTAGKNWAAFGFIAAEVELQRSFK